MKTLVDQMFVIILIERMIDNKVFHVSFYAAILAGLAGCEKLARRSSSALMVFVGAILKIRASKSSATVI
jgi:hypothetical protein